MGLQDKFSFKGVALAALTAGIGKGLGNSGAFGKLGIGGKGFGAVVARGALTEFAVQGVGIATGLQSKFDFAGVAAAGIGAGVGNAVGGTRFAASLGDFGGRLATNAASGFANAATRSVLTGTDFGDNIIAALPQVIGQTIGGFVEDRIARSKSSAPSQANGRAEEGSATSPGASSVFDENGFNQAAFNTLRYQTALLAAGGDVAAARNLIKMSYGPSEDQAREQAVAAPDTLEIDATYDRTTEAPKYHYIGRPTLIPNHWKSNGSSSFGNNYPVGDGQVAWIEDAATMQLVNADLANFDLQFGLFAAGPAVIGGLGAGAVLAAPSVAAFVLLHAPALTTGTQIFGEAITGVPLAPIGAIGALAAAETKLAGGTFDLGVSSSQYTLKAPTIGGFERATGTVNTRAFVVHGNSALSPRPATLYELYQVGESGSMTFLKNGISQNPATRYSKSFMEDKRFFEIATGPRADMLALERQRTIQNPGPLNFEPWAVKARSGQ